MQFDDSGLIGIHYFANIINYKIIKMEMCDLIRTLQNLNSFLHLETIFLDISFQNYQSDWSSKVSLALSFFLNLDSKSEKYFG